MFLNNTLKRPILLAKPRVSINFLPQIFFRPTDWRPVSVGHNGAAPLSNISGKRKEINQGT